jgi:predicted nucleic-acid-binding Zn-ribbon protein
MRAREGAKCGGGQLLQVVQMDETTYYRRVPLGEIDRVAPLETIVCKQCGYAVWYCDAYEDLCERPGRVTRVRDERQQCADCSSPVQFLVAELHERPDHPVVVGRGETVDSVPLAVLRGGWRDPVGHFALLVCSECGRSEWFTWGIDEHTRGSRVVADPCLRCNTDTRRYVQPLREESGEALPVAFHGEFGVGEFEVRCCDRCGLSEWYARKIDRLHVDGKRVIELPVERPMATPSAGGPYR